MRARGGIVEGRSYIAQMCAERQARRAAAARGGVLPVAAIQPGAPKRERSTQTRFAMPAEDRIEDELRAGLQRHWHHLTDTQRKAIIAAVTSGLPISAAVTR